MPAPPRRIEPRFVERPWGAPSLDPYFPGQTSGPRIGEVWFEAGGLLIKFLFTTEALSVQVHPDDIYARARENSAGKTEMWHVLRAGPEARIALGFQRTLDRAEVRRAALDGSIGQLLAWHRPEPGDTFFTPAGTVHALGPGLVVLEIQQISDVTYRLYDYNRGRELHLDKALEVLHPDPHPGRSAPQPLGDGGTMLVSCPYFRVEQWSVRTARAFPGGSALILLEGGGLLEDLPASPGQVWSLEEKAIFFPQGHATLVCAHVPES